jgi:hypothetical protein
MHTKHFSNGDNGDHPKEAERLQFWGWMAARGPEWFPGATPTRCPKMPHRYGHAPTLARIPAHNCVEGVPPDFPSCYKPQCFTLYHCTSHPDNLHHLHPSLSPFRQFQPRAAISGNGSASRLNLICYCKALILKFFVVLLRKST